MKEKENLQEKITVFGAYGHTGKFVVAELVKRGLTPILVGRDSSKLKKLGEVYPNLEIRSATIDDAASLDTALAEASAVINCAGPFLDTGKSLIEAAIRNRVNYLDVAAEQMAVKTAFENYADSVREQKSSFCRRLLFTAGSPICWRQPPSAIGRRQIKSKFSSLLTVGIRLKAHGLRVSATLFGGSFFKR